MNAKTDLSKGSRYADRNLRSIPAPLSESDYDSDFAPGAYVPEIPKKGRGRKASAPKAGTKRGRRSDVLDGIAKAKKRKITRTRPTVSHNPLLEYFPEVINCDDEPSNNEKADDEADAEEDEDEESDEDMSEGERPSSPLMLKSKRPTSPPPSTKGEKMATTVPPADDDSATEPESDVDFALPPPHVTSFKKPKQPNGGNDDESITEPESDADMDFKCVPAKQPPRKSVVDDSETEPDSDIDFDDFSLLKSGSTLLDAAHDAKDSYVLDVTYNIRVPPSLNKYLREYQREGVKFLFDRYVVNCGAVLGDDMGLGKTIQVISFLSALMHKTGTPSDIDRRRNHVSKLQDGREWREHRKLPPPDASWPTALIIVPSSVVGVWAREFPKWGYFEVGVYTGPADKRDEVLNDFKMGRLDVVVTSFDVARIAIDNLDTLPWTVLIVDEAHRLKNPKSKSTLALSSLAWPEDHHVPWHITRLKSLASADSKPEPVPPRTGPIRIALTGTAIQNSYFELWTLLDWANPGSVGTMAQWKKAVADPLTAGQAKGCSDEDRLRANDTAHALAEKLLPKFFLRRTKDIIKNQLPKKFDEVVFCPLTSRQIVVYKRILAMDAVQDMIKRDERCDCGSRKKRKECCHPFVAGDLFKYMSTLIKISNHLALILPAPNDTQEQTARNRELSAIAFPNGHVPKYGPSMLEAEYCGKWKVLETLLNGWCKDPTNKVLIFTKSVKLLDMLVFHLENQSYKFVKLDGSTKASDRMPLIDKFQQDPDVFVFLISTLAGGTGLNLTAANKVVVFDPNWNPAHDLQAMDRAYRFGQMRDVSVYRLLGAGSIEELIYARQVYKQQQMVIGYEASVQTRYFSGVSGDKSKQGELFGLQNIFKLHEDTSTTKMAIERANIGNLDWALGHMDVVKSKAAAKKKGPAEAWVYEVEAKELKEDADLKGLGAFLFDDSVPQVRKDDVTKILDSYGIKYSHRNDELLVPSHIDKERDKVALQERRKRVKKAKEEREAKKVNKAPEPEWPPRRRHHKLPPSPRSKLGQRQKALIDLGMIQTPADLPVFAQDFAMKSQEEQNEILSRLDEHALKRL